MTTIYFILSWIILIVLMLFGLKAETMPWGIFALWIIFIMLDLNWMTKLIKELEIEYKAKGNKF